MQNILFFLTFFLFAGLALQAQENKLIFFEGNFTQFQTRALNAEKPQLVYIYANWSLVAKKMNEETLTDARLVNYVTSKYLAIAYDGESVLNEGAELAKRFQVIFFPTILVLTPEGRLLEKLPGYLTADELLKKLRSHEKARGTPEVAQFRQEMLPPQKPGEFLYKVSANTIPQAGFGVLVMSSKQYRQVFAKVVELEKTRFHKNVLVFSRDLPNGEVDYRVLLGPFPLESQALVYHESLLKQPYYRGATVVNLAEL
jgi:thioredoxin-related protein